MRSLKSLGVMPDSYGALLSSVLLNKLQTELRLIVSRKVSGCRFTPKDCGGRTAFQGTNPHPNSNAASSMPGQNSPDYNYTLLWCTIFHHQSDMLLLSALPFFQSIVPQCLVSVHKSRFSELVVVVSTVSERVTLVATVDHQGSA